MVQVPIRNVQDGYMNSFRPPESLSDDAVRKRAAAAGMASPAPVEPTWGPLVPEMNQAPRRPSRKGPGGPAWSPGDRRQLGGFDARFHSTSACAPTLPVRKYIPATDLPIVLACARDRQEPEQEHPRRSGAAPNASDTTEQLPALRER